MEQYVTKIEAKTNRGATVTYEVTSWAGTERDAAEKCKLKAQYELHDIELEFADMVEVWQVGGRSCMHRVD